MKKVIVINGPIGVGKTTVGKLLCNKLYQSAFIDGDWCFDLHPFIANKETKAILCDWRIEEWLNVSKRSLNYFEGLDTIHIDTSYETAINVADKIYEIVA